MSERTTSAAAERLRLLVIQDSAAEAGRLREALAATGASLDLDFTQTLADAEHRVRQGRYDCVLLDLALPNANGVDNVQRIRSANRGQTVVVMTRLDNEHVRIKDLIRSELGNGGRKVQPIVHSSDNVHEALDHLTHLGLSEHPAVLKHMQKNAT